MRNNKNTSVTWGDLLLSTCRKMFLNKNPLKITDIETIKDDRNYATYINMAPDVMNECMTILANRVFLNIKTMTIDLEDVNLPITKPKYYKVDLNLLLPEDTNYLNTVVIQKYGENIPNIYFDEDESFLYIDNKIIDKYSDKKIIIKYQYKFEKITIDTPFDTIINLPTSLVDLIPLYLASELYKDDDISIATTYRNQFETELDYISNQLVDFLGTDVVRDVKNYGY